jgi:hypothetical protein
MTKVIAAWLLVLSTRVPVATALEDLDHCAPLQGVACRSPIPDPCV